MFLFISGVTDTLTRIRVQTHTDCSLADPGRDHLCSVAGGGAGSDRLRGSAAALHWTTLHLSHHHTARSRHVPQCRPLWRQALANLLDVINYLAFATYMPIEGIEL